MATQISHHFIRLFFKTALLTACLSESPAVLAENNSPNGFPTMPGFTLMGLTGENTTGYADAMLPLLGQPTRFFYLDPQGLLHSNDDYTGSLGAGFRYLHESAGILGAYVFGDYNHSPNGNSFWFVSPGVERLGNTVDFSANLYIPVSDQRKDLSTGIAETMGIYNYITFSQHSQFDRVLTTFESVGTGADAEIGFRIPMRNNPKVYVGGYYFDPKDAEDNIKGMTARLEVPLTERFTLIASDAYDNAEHNTVKVGASFNFGGRKSGKSFKGDLAERMVDPIHRNLIATSGSAKTGQPIVQTDLQPGETVLIKDHIAFFNATANSGGDGTFERPFNLFNQTNVDTANLGDNRNLYVNTGTYVNTSTIKLINDNLYGRQSFNGSPFVQPAEGDARPVFILSSASATAVLTPMGDSVFDSIKVTESGTIKSVGISLVNPANQNTNFLINNSDLNNFQYGIQANNAGNVFNLVINNTSLSQNTAGLSAVNNPTANTFNITTNNSSFSNNDFSGLIVVGSGSKVNLTLNQSIFNNNGGDGVLVPTFDSAVCSLVSNQSSFKNNAFNGLEINNNSSARSNVIANQSTFEGNSEYGVFGENLNPDPTSTHITLNQPVFSANGIADTNKDNPSGANIVWVIN